MQIQRRIESTDDLILSKMPSIERRNVLVGIRIDSQSREVLSWALVKVAEPGDCVIAVHVCRNSKVASITKPLLDSYLQEYDGLCSLKKVDLIGKVCEGNSTPRTLVQEAKNHGAVALVLGISRSRTCTVGYCAKQLPSTTNVLSIHNGKILFESCNNNQQTGPCGDPRPSVNLPEFRDSEIDADICSYQELTRSESGNSKDDPILINENKKRPSSVFTGDILDQRPGWPLLRRATSASPETLQARQLPVVKWAMNLPNRSPHKTPLGSVIDKNHILNVSNRISLYSAGGLHNGFEILLKTNSSSCKWFNYEVLKTATSKFNSGNLIGKGECSSVYKGILADGRPVAVKIQKSSQEAWKDFVQEVEIISSLNHKNIIRLIGVCIKDNDLISVYDFFSKGSLEDNLHGKNKQASPLPWEVRFDVALKIAEALNYLHNECARPVIHRDIKSSNILLSQGFEPQLSDFGLAIWGPTTSSYTTQGDVVGTFGYFAPEYFMYGKVSDKVDVYAFGVVLLELLSGKKPIGDDSSKGQESLVMWANSFIECGNIQDIIDPNLDKNLDKAQMQGMIVAAKLCITRSARLRPKMSEILTILRGDKDAEMLVNIENQDNNGEEVDSDCEADIHLNVAMIDGDDDSTSLGSWEQGNIMSMEDYFKERWNRSSSFN